MAALFLSGTITFQSCNDHDFDWEAVRSQNAEYLYENNFKSLFGEIDPNQEWDFSKANPGSGTRAFDEDGNYTWPSKTNPGFTWSTDWYDVPQDIIDYIGDNIGFEDKDNSSKGHPFTLVFPTIDDEGKIGGGLRITPIYQGANSATTLELHMKVTDKTTNTTKDYTLWTKGQHMQRWITCTTCKGTGTESSNWDQKIYTIQNNYSYSSGGLFWYSTTTNFYLNGANSSTTQGKYAIIPHDGKNYLYSINANAYLYVNNGVLSTTTEIEKAGELDYTSGSTLSIDGYYLQISGDRSGTLSISKTSETNNNNKWKWTSSNATNTQKNTINNILPEEKCHTCNGEGHVWDTVGSDDSAKGTAGTTKRDDVVINSITQGKKIPVDSIKSQTLSIPTGSFKAGDEIVFWTKVYNSGTQGPYYCTGSTALILSLTDCPQPKDKDVMIIACEGGGDTDINDLVLLLEGDPWLPGIRDVKGWAIVDSKRYMVEDMGYSTKNTAAVDLGYTDIDFNDIVIDFDRTREYEDEYDSGTFKERHWKNNYKTVATVRALGGTWDFELKVNGTPIFSKSASRKSAVSSGAVIYPAVQFNQSYFVSNRSLDEIGQFNPTLMYNTGQVENGDGNYAPNINALASWLCKIDNVQNWNPETNNIQFEIKETDGTKNIYNSQKELENGDITEESTTKNVYSLTFPAPGATPKIVAFPNIINSTTNMVTGGKTWQREKVHVTKLWFSDVLHSVNSNGDFLNSNEEVINN